MHKTITEANAVHIIYAWEVEDLQEHSRRYTDLKDKRWKTSVTVRILLTEVKNSEKLPGTTAQNSREEIEPASSRAQDNGDGRNVHRDWYQQWFLLDIVQMIEAHKTLSTRLEPKLCKDRIYLIPVHVHADNLVVIRDERERGKKRFLENLSFMLHWTWNTRGWKRQDVSTAHRHTGPWQGHKRFVDSTIHLL